MDAGSRLDAQVEAAMRRHPTGRHRLTRAERGEWERLSADLEAGVAEREGDR